MPTIVRVAHFDVNLSKFLGEGGFGKVFRAKDISEDPPMEVAAKQVPFGAAPDGWRSAMFAEARGDQLGRELLTMLAAAGAAELSETESAMAAGFTEEEAEHALKAVADAL